MRIIYGFTAIISKDISKILYQNTNFYKSDNMIIFNNMIKKFEDDKIFNKFDNLFLCIDGVILNKKQLINQYAKKDFKELCQYLYKINGINFIKELRGNFNGFIYDKNSTKYYFFTNHLGTKFLYYYKDDNNIIISSKISQIVRYMKMLGINPKLNELGAYFLLTYGYMLEDYTLIKNVKKVKSGTYMEFIENNLKEKRYYCIDNEEYTVDDLNKITKKLYERFCLAIKQGFDKDLEYGYKHIQLLSGGLDSRMIAFFAKKLGYEDILTISFGEGNCLDQSIASQISRDLKFEHLVYYLDNGKYLMNIDKCVNLNDGEIIYNGLAHSYAILSKLNLEDYGLLHNGNVADVMHGNYTKSENHNKVGTSQWGFSTKLLNKIKNDVSKIFNNYKNDEMFAIYNRGIACNNGSVAAWGFTETDETYSYFDLIDYATTIPPKYKYREYAFISMINKYMPNATNYTYASWGVKPKMIQLNLRKNNIYTKMQQKYNVIFHNVEMNPHDKWMQNNLFLKEFIIDYFNKNIDRLTIYPELRKDCIYLFNSGNCNEKLQVLNLLSAYKQLIDEI